MKSGEWSRKCPHFCANSFLVLTLIRWLFYFLRNPLSSAIAAVSFVKSTAKEQVNEAETRQALLNDVEIIDLSLQYINTLLVSTCILSNLQRLSKRSLLSRYFIILFLYLQLCSSTC